MVRDEKARGLEYIAMSWARSQLSFLTLLKHNVNIEKLGERRAWEVAES